jgi:hypothetical protein
MEMKIMKSVDHIGHCCKEWKHFAAQLYQVLKSRYCYWNATQFQSTRCLWREDKQNDLDQQELSSKQADGEHPYLALGSAEYGIPQEGKPVKCLT